MTVGALSSKDKAGDKPNTFVFEIASRKWRTLFSAPTPELVATWVGGFQAAIDLGTFPLETPKMLTFDSFSSKQHFWNNHP